MKFELCYVDTCLADYWSGHHLPTLQVPVWRGMTFKELKHMLSYDLRVGAIGGSGELAQHLGECESEDPVLLAAEQAIENMTLNNPAENPDDTQLFLELLEEDPEEDAESVYAFFVFREVDDD